LCKRALFREAQVNVQARIDHRNAVVVAGGKICGPGATGGNFGAQRGQGLGLFNIVFRYFGFAGQSILPYCSFIGFGLTIAATIVQ